MSSSRIIEIGLMFTSLSPLLALALLILSWLAGTADACPLWAEDSRAPGPASLTPSRPIVLRRLRWKGADTALGPSCRAEMLKGKRQTAHAHLTWNVRNSASVFFFRFCKSACSINFTCMKSAGIQPKSDRKLMLGSVPQNTA